MVDPTLIQFANASAPIVIQSAQSTNWIQFGLSLFTSLLVGFGMFVFLLSPAGVKALFVAHRLKKVTGRRTLVVSHGSGSAFSPQMIDGSTLSKVTRFLLKYPDEAVNLVLQTPGGVVFHSMAISKVMMHHGRVSVYVPSYAMSGGTLMACSGARILMSPWASLGPVDPQVGTWWTGGSADTWKKVMKLKGKLARDESVGFDSEGRKYTKLIADHFKGLGLKPQAVILLTRGDLPHAHLFGLEDVSSWFVDDFRVQGMSDGELKACRL